MGIISFFKFLPFQFKLFSNNGTKFGGPSNRTPLNIMKAYKIIKSNIHRKGLCAARNIKKGERIISRNEIFNYQTNSRKITSQDKRFFIKFDNFIEEKNTHIDKKLNWSD